MEFPGIFKHLWYSEQNVCVKLLDYLVVELSEAALQVQRARVGEFGEHLQMGNQLSVRKKTIPTQRSHIVLQTIFSGCMITQYISQ